MKILQFSKLKTSFFVDFVSNITSDARAVSNGNILRIHSLAESHPSFDKKFTKKLFKDTWGLVRKKNNPLHFLVSRIQRS